MVARYHLARGTGLALVEQDEVFDQVEQPVRAQHAVEQGDGGQVALVGFLLPLPFVEVLPLAGDRAVAGLIAVRHHEEGVVVEGMGDHVLVQVVAQVVVEAGADVLVHRLELDEYQRQPVDEADEVGAAVVVRRTQAGQLEFAHGEEAVGAGRIGEIDHPRPRRLLPAVRIAVAHRHAAAQQSVEVAVVLYQRAADIEHRHRAHCLVDGHRRKLRVQPHQRGAQVALQHGLLRVVAAQRARRAEGLGVPSVDALPAERLLKMVGERLLDQTVFAVEAGHRHAGLLIGQRLGGDLPAHQAGKQEVAGLS